MPSNRDALVRGVLSAGRELNSAAVMFSSALAQARMLSFVEAKALDLLERFGPLTAGELAHRSGLAPASVTGLVDRLARKGFARRSRHPKDGRRVLVEAVTRPGASPDPTPFRDVNGALRELCAQYTNDQLAAIASFTAAAARRTRDAAIRINPPPGRNGLSTATQREAR